MAWVVCIWVCLLLNSSRIACWGGFATIRTRLSFVFLMKTPILTEYNIQLASRPNFVTRHKDNMENSFSIISKSDLSKNRRGRVSLSPVMSV
eukprot:scaffold88144_cov71-Cyclotella_meneghiniana.AAC.5